MSDRVILKKTAPQYNALLSREHIILLQQEVHKLRPLESVPVQLPVLLVTTNDAVILPR